MAFRDLSIGKKMIIVCMVTSITALLLAIVIMMVVEQYSFRRTQEQEIRVLADIIASHSQAALLFGDGAVATENLKSLSAREAIVCACVYLTTNETSDSLTPATQLFAEYHRDRTRFPACPDITAVKASLAAADGVAYHDGYFDVVRNIDIEDKPIGSVLIRTADIDAAARLRENLYVAGFVAMLAGLIALLIASRLEKLISTPLQKLGETARQITQNDNYSLRAEKFGDDDIGTVVDSFNRMLQHIEREDAVLRESEERFRLFTASSSAGIFQTDIHGHCNYCNHRLTEIGQTTYEDVLNHGWLSLVHPEDRDQVQAAWQHTLRSGEPMVLNCRFDNHGTQEPIWVNGNIGPLSNGHGQAIGFLGTLADISELKKAQLQLEHLAFYDMLTGLANRRLFRDRIEHILAIRSRNAIELGLLLIDIDHFKHTNDTLGHDSGDILLREVGERLSRSVRTADTVARLGGDEFCIILEDIRDSHAVTRIASNILAELRRPIYLGGHEIIVTASIGIALSVDINEPSAEQLIKQADLALYRSKDEGRNCYRFYEEEMNTSLVEHLQLVRDFREALYSNEFMLHYQPQFNIADKSIVGFEALVRWISPKRGFVSPLDFIPIAEETGLIIELGNWILLRACQDMKTLTDDGLVDPHCVIAVNLSVKQLLEDTLVENVTQALSVTGLPPHQLELEITESMLMENIDRALRNLEEIRKLGVQLAIDDFGTGYSSLSYLKRLPVHTIKVDRSFVLDIPVDKDDMEITAAVIAMAHKLNYKVVAEGIETPEQQAFLQECHCDYGQGYIFSKPIPLHDIRQFCQQQRTPGATRLPA